MKKVLPAFLALSFAAAAQTTTNVPGVTLSGDPANPRITNHSGKPVIAALVVMTLTDKTTAITRRLFTNTADRLPDGGSELVGEYSRKIPHSMYVGANVQAVIFADGEFRGDDNTQAQFRDNIERTLQAIRKVWQMANAGDWAAVKAEADGSGDGNLYAGRLIFQRERPGAGEAKAVSLYAHWALLPTSTWKGGLLNRLQFVPNIFQAIAEWLLPTAYAQSNPFNNVQPYPQGTGTAA